MKLAFNARLLGGLFMGSLAATATLPPSDPDAPRPWWRNPFMQLKPPQFADGPQAASSGVNHRGMGSAASPSTARPEASSAARGSGGSARLDPPLYSEDPLLVRWAVADASGGSAGGAVPQALEFDSRMRQKKAEDASLAEYAGLAQPSPSSAVQLQSQGSKAQPRVQLTQQMSTPREKDRQGGWLRWNSPGQPPATSESNKQRESMSPSPHSVPSSAPQLSDEDAALWAFTSVPDTKS